MREIELYVKGQVVRLQLCHFQSDYGQNTAMRLFSLHLWPGDYLQAIKSIVVVGKGC